MNYLWVIIIALVTFIGGILTEYGIQHGLPPKTQIINQNNYQDVKTENTSIQSSEQAQITTTVVTPSSNYHITINYNGKTNHSQTFSSRTNRSSKTNETKEPPLIPKLKFNIP